MQENHDKQRQTEHGKQQDMAYKYNVSTTRILELDAIKKEDIATYLESCGYKRESKTSLIIWFKAPWRNEERASLAIYHKKTPQDWYDYGENVGGSLIDLTMKLHGIPYVEAIKKLREYVFQ